MKVVSWPCWFSSPELRLQLPYGSLICRSHSGQLLQSQVTRAKLITPPSSDKHPWRPRQMTLMSSLLLKTCATWSSVSYDRGGSLTETYYLQDLVLWAEIPLTVFFWWRSIEPGPSGKELDSGQITKDVTSCGVETPRHFPLTPSSLIAWSFMVYGYST